MPRISKKNMGDKVKDAAASAPGLVDRLKHAQDVMHAHPALNPTASAATPKEPVLPSAVEVRFVTVSVDLVDENPFNARKVYRPERVNELAASIGAHGQDVPGIATTRNGRYVLAAGHYRRRAIKLLGLKTIDLMVHEGLTDKQLFEYSYRENAEREGQSALDNALCWRDLLDQKLYVNETELAEATGISLSSVNKTLQILQLSEPIREVIKQDPSAFALTALYELVLFERVAGGRPALEMVNKLLTGDAGRKEVQEARAKLEDPRERKRKETSRAYKIQRDGAEIGAVKVWDSGRVLLDVVLPDSAERDKVLADLKQQFGVSL